VCYSPDEKLPHNPFLLWLGKGLYRFLSFCLLHRLRYSVPKDSSLHSLVVLLSLDTPQNNIPNNPACVVRIYQCGWNTRVYEMEMKPWYMCDTRYP